MKPSRPKRTPERMEAPAIAGEAVREWDVLQSRLAPIIGEDGFRVLFQRSLHRARIEHAWLARETLKADAGAFSSLKKSLESETPESASRGSQALVATFHELLNGLIGEELATRLLLPVLPPAEPPNQEIDR